MEQNEMMKDEDRQLHRMLETAYRMETVPEDVNIRLKNQIACWEMMREKSISFWWLPALASTVIAVAGFAVSVLICLLIQTKSADFIMPNLTRLLCSGWLRIELVAALFQIGSSWIFTAVGLWKLNFRKRAHIF